MMDCQNIMAPSDEALLSHALDNQPLTPQASTHLAQCSICQQRLADITRLNSYLISRLYRSLCPSPTTLSHYCANLLPPDDAIPVALHLEQCPLCAREVAETRSILSNFDPLAAIPGFLASSQASPIRSAHNGASTAIQRIIASLVPWQPQLVTRDDPTDIFSIANERVSWPRQYRAGSMNISLHLSRASNGEIMLLGLLSSTDPKVHVESLEGTTVELYRSTIFHEAADPASAYASHDEPTPPPLMSTFIDDLGNIVFKAVPAGSYSILVHAPTNQLLIKGLTIDSG